MSTDELATQVEDEERIRKIYAKDLRNGETVHTVFKALGKERHTSRAGKPYLAMTLVDRTGEVDARIFENVDLAEGAFQPEDYLLVMGKVGNFHGKPQIVVERLERLDPEPIDASEFAYVRAPPAVAVPVEERKAEERKPEERKPEERAEKKKDPDKLPRRVQRLLESKEGVSALDAVLAAVERLVDERVAARLDAKERPERSDRPERADRPERHERAERRKGPRVEHRPKVEESRGQEPKRDPSLPEGLAFKPLTELLATPAEEGAPEGSAAESTEGSGV